MQGKYEQAEALFKQVLEAQSRLLVPEQMFTLNTFAGPAFLHQRQGKYAGRDVAARPDTPPPIPVPAARRPSPRMSTPEGGVGTADAAILIYVSAWENGTPSFIKDLAR